jgi:hypothetical protein
MNGINRVLGGALVGWSAIAWAANAQAQNAAGRAAGESPFAEATRAEKSPAAEGAAPAKANVMSDDFCECVGGSDSLISKKIEMILRGPLSAQGLDFTDQPLNDVIATIQDEYDIPIQLDQPALDAIGVKTDEPVNVNLHNISLRSALRLMLKRLNLTFEVENEVLCITTPDEAEKKLRICVYNVSSVAGENDSQLSAITDIIESCVATETWAKNGGGEAEIRPIQPGLLVISQTARIHEEIHDLLAAIRKMRSESVVAAIQPAKATASTPGEVVTRSYLLQLSQGKDNEATRSQVRELVEASFPDEMWKGKLSDGQAVTLAVFPDRVVVRQTPAVQEKVEKLLTDSGIAMSAPAVASNDAGRGGMDGGGFGGAMGGGGGGGFFRPKDIRPEHSILVPNSTKKLPSTFDSVAPEPGDDNPFGP